MAERIDLNLMQVFDALMRERSVSRAAERLGIGQPATSAALSRLRTLLGDELFVRGLGTMTPTSRASAVYPPVRDALLQIARAVGPGETFDPAQDRRVFRISGGDYAAMTLLPLLYSEVRREAPFADVRFRFVEKDAVFTLLERGELDLAIGVYPRAPKSLGRSPLIRESFVCLLRHDNPALDGRLSLDAFCQLPHILVTERGDDTGAVDTALQKLGRSRRVVLTVPHLLTVPTLVAASDSVATVGRRVAAICRHSFDDLTVFDPPLKLASWELSQLWSRQQSGDAGLAWLRAKLEQVAAMPPDPALGRSSPSGGLNPTA